MDTTVVLAPVDDGPGCLQDFEGTTARRTAVLERMGYDVRTVASAEQASYVAGANLRAVCRIEGRQLWIESEHMASGCGGDDCLDQTCQHAQVAYLVASRQAAEEYSG